MNTETRTLSERQVSPETPGFQEGLVGLQARLLLGGDAVNPENTSIEKVADNQLFPLLEKNYAIVQKASLAERKNYWKEKGIGDFNSQKRQWVEGVVRAFAQGKEFFQNSQQGQEWNVFLGRIGINAIEFSAADAETLYTRYFESAGKNGLYVFVKEVIEKTDNQTSGKIDYNKLHQNLPVIQWLAGMFGEQSSEVVTQLVNAEAKLQDEEQKNRLIEEANGKEAKDNTEVLRINNLQPREKEILKFLWNGRGFKAETPPLESESQTDEDERSAPTDRRRTGPEQDSATPENITQYEGPVNIDRVLAGKGFEEIEKHGWDEYRKALTSVSFTQMIERQMQDIERLQQEAAQNPQMLSEEDLIKLNREAIARVDQLIQALPTKYPESSDNPFYCFKSSSSKLAFCGKEFDFDATPYRRIYFPAYTRTAPEAFMSLAQALQEEGAIETTNLSLYLDNFHPDSENNNFYDNSIILYISGEQPDIMTKIARAVQKAKNRASEAWQMYPQDLADVKINLLQNFKIPLDDTAGFVEMGGPESFDANEQRIIRDELRAYEWRQINGKGMSLQMPADLQTMVERMKKYTPGNQGEFKHKGFSMKLRRKYMPGLLHGLLADHSIPPAPSRPTADDSPTVRATDTPRAPSEPVGRAEERIDHSQELLTTLGNFTRLDDPTKARLEDLAKQWKGDLPVQQQYRIIHEIDNIIKELVERGQEGSYTRQLHQIISRAKRELAAQKIPPERTRPMEATIPGPESPREEIAPFEIANKNKFIHALTELKRGGKRTEDANRELLRRYGSAVYDDTGGERPDEPTTMALVDLLQTIPGIKLSERVKNEILSRTTMAASSSGSESLLLENNAEKLRTRIRFSTPQANNNLVEIIRISGRNLVTISLAVDDSGNIYTITIDLRDRELNIQSGTINCNTNGNVTDVSRIPEDIIRTGTRISIHDLVRNLTSEQSLAEPYDTKSLLENCLTKH